MPATKRYRLAGVNSTVIESETPGTLGGNRRARIYGRLDCSTAIRALTRGYARQRVFFASEAAAIAAGYRPCGHCMRAEYARWRQGGVPGTDAYPWLITPRAD